VPADVRVKRAALGSSARTIVAADQTKPGAVTFGRFCPLSAVERLVADAPPASAADLQALGLAVDHV
jgi:DeoR/GlpR family transcriptional regulator of sugar metabolism